jgi:alpha-D-xyloside xylohydrolase
MVRFFDGNWLIRDGITAHFAMEAYDSERGDGEYSLFCPDRPIKGRADTVDCGLLTIRVAAAAEGVIRVRISHFEGGRERAPRFELRESGTQGAEVAQAEDGALSLRSGRLLAKARLGAPYRLEFFDLDPSGAERRLTWAGERGTAWMEVAGEGSYVLEQLALGVGERAYGLGERFTPFVRNGQSVDIWNRDGGTSSEQAYKNIPFYLSSSGYGVLVNHPGRVSFELGTERVARVGFSAPGQVLEYYVIAGPAPKDVLRRLALLSGQPALPPAWSFGLWLTTSFTTSYDERTVMGFIEGMASRGLPLRVFHFDCFWMKEYQLCGLEWDKEVFPDPASMLGRIKKAGVKICLWINPYIAQRTRMFAEGREKGYLLRDEAGDVWQWDRWQAGMALVDFTNPAARDWYADKLRALVDMGADCFKTDFGERIPVDARYFDGSDPERMHNYYTLVYNRLVFEVLEEKLGKGEAVLFARSATVGGQQYPVHWGGDCSASFESMAESLRGGLSLGLSGFGFWSHDIGGFEDRASPAVYKRWVAFGLLSSHSRLHGSKEYRVPWIYDDEAVDVLRFFTKLKHALMPYIYAAAAEASSDGVPVMRAMILEFPGDEACGYLDRQYMLGPSLLVAPVFEAEGEVSYYLPAGRWTRVLSGEAVEGGSWIHERHGFMSLPLLARPNSILAFGSREDLPDYDYAEGAEFHVFEPVEGERAEAIVTDLKGKAILSCRTLLSAGKLSVKLEGRPGRHTIILRNSPAASHARGRRSERGLEIDLEAGAEASIDLE